MTGAPRWRAGEGSSCSVAQEAQPELDQQDAKFQSDGSQAVASVSADTFDEALSAELAQVVSKLAESVLIVDEVMASGDARVQFARGPVTDEATGMEQRFEHPDNAVIVEFKT